MNYVDYYTQWAGIVAQAKKASSNASSHPASSNIGNQLSNVISSLNSMLGNNALNGDGAVSGLASALKGQVSIIGNIQAYFNSYSTAETAYITLDENLTKLKEEDSKFKKLSNNKPKASDFKEKELNKTTNKFEEHINHSKYKEALSKWETNMKICKNNCDNLNSQIMVCVNCLKSFGSASPTAGGVSGNWNFEPVHLEAPDYDWTDTLSNDADLTYGEWIAAKHAQNGESYSGVNVFKDTYSNTDREVLETFVKNGDVDGAKNYIAHNFKGDAKDNANGDLASILREYKDNGSSLNQNVDQDWRLSYQTDLSNENNNSNAKDPLDQRLSYQGDINPNPSQQEQMQTKVDAAIERMDNARNERLEKADSTLSSNSPQTATVNTNKRGLNVRTEPNGQILTSIPKDSTIRVISDDGSGWTKVKLNDGTTGYVSSKWLKINDKSTNMDASTTSINTSGTNSIISPSNVSGYVKNDTPILSVVSTNGSNLKLRSGPGTDNTKIGSISNNTEINVLGQSGNWSHVKVGDEEGWVYSSYLSTNKNK